VSGCLLGEFVWVRALVSKREHPAERGEHRPLAPASGGTAASDSPHSLDESADDGEQKIERCQPYDQTLHGPNLEASQFDALSTSVADKHAPAIDVGASSIAGVGLFEVEGRGELWGGRAASLDERPVARALMRSGRPGELGLRQARLALVGDAEGVDL
jgi:hypothetical protein